MAQIKNWLERSLVVGGVTLLVIVGIPLLFLTAIAVRPLLIVALILGGVTCAILYYFSPAFRKWFEDAGKWQISESGLRLATDVAMHPSHSWARIGPKDVAVGADDFVPATLGPVQAVDLPPVGSRVKQGDRLVGLRRGNRCLELRSPISGTVVQRNEALLEDPGLVNEGPFAEGWAVRLRADDLRHDRPHLLVGKRAREWFRQQIDRLVGTLASERAAVPTLPDGGTLVPDLYQQIDDGAWQRLQETFFSAGAPAA